MRSTTGARRRSLAATVVVALVVGGVLIAAVLDSGGAAKRAAPSTATPTAPGSTVRVLGSFADQVARLPELAAGELTGRLVVGGEDCSGETIELRTMRRRPLGQDPRICPDLRNPVSVVLLRTDDQQNPTQVGATDRSGRELGKVWIPHGWEWFATLPDGIAVCRDWHRARVLLFAGGARRLPSCPVGQIGTRTVLLSPDRRSLVDLHGRTLLTLRRTAATTDFGVWRDDRGVITVVWPKGVTELYRNGRLLTVVRLGSGCPLVSASIDGRVTVGSCPDGMVVSGGGHRPRRVQPEFAQGQTLLSPDGSHLLVSAPGGRALVMLDAATLAPLRRVPVSGEVWSAAWLP